MNFDVAHPFVALDQRDETFVVFFDGFIKNTTEGMIRTMLRDPDDWVEYYPHLLEYDDYTVEELYDHTMLYQPAEMLSLLSENERDEDDIQKDLDTILPEVFLGLSQDTTFEYTLFAMLKNAFVKKCYIYKEGIFYQNEIDFISIRYKEFADKMEFVDDVNFPDFLGKVDPTTIFLTDPAFLFDYLVNEMTPEEKNEKMFVLLAGYRVVEYNPESKIFEYTEEFQDLVKEINENDTCLIGGMFNFRIEGRE